MRNVRTRRTALGLLSTAALAVLLLGTGTPASALTVEIPRSTVDARGRLVLLDGWHIVLRAAEAPPGGSYRWSVVPEDGGDAVTGEGEELRPRLGIGVYEVSLEAGAETARAVLVVRRVPVVVVGGWAGGLDREAIAALSTDYDVGYREDVLDPLADATLTPNAWLDVFGRRSIRSGYAPLLAEMIAETKYRTGVDCLDVVAFGTAGLAVRWLVRNQAPSGIRRVVSVGTPGHGTDLASPSFRAFEHRAGLVAGKRLADVLEGLGPEDGAELLEMSDRLKGRLPQGLAPERVAASLVALRSPELAPHSSFLEALNGHRGMYPASAERGGGAVELALAGVWGRTATHLHVTVPRVGASVAVPRFAGGDRVSVAGGAGWGSGAVRVEGLSYLEESLDNPALLPAILDFLQASRTGPPPPLPGAPQPPRTASQLLFAEGLGFYPPYPHKYDFGVEASARSLVLTFFSPAKLSLLLSYRTPRGVKRLFASSPGVETVSSPGMTEVHLGRPPANAWTAEVTGKKGEAYSVSATYETTTYLAAGVSKPSVLPGKPVTVYGYAVQPNRDRLVPLPVEVAAKVWLGEESFGVPLYDDGYHDDGQADDGLYAGTFQATERPGTYLVVVEGNLLEGRRQLHRWAYERFTVEALPDLAINGKLLLCDASPRASEPFGVAVLVENRGAADATGAVVELLREGPSRFGSRLLARDVVDVAAGDRAVARFFVELPAGEHRLLARISALNGFLESSYRDNASRVAVRLAAPEGAPAAAASETGLEILSPPSGARIGERAVVTVRATGSDLEAVEVEVNGRGAGSCAAGGRTEVYCHVPVDAPRGKKLRVAAVARSAGGGTVRREARYTLDRKAPELRVGEVTVEEPNRLHLPYLIRSRKGAGEVLAVTRRTLARAADGEVEIEASPGDSVLLYAADRACNLARETYVFRLRPEIKEDGFEDGDLSGWNVAGGKPSG